MLVHLGYYWPWRARLCLPAWQRRMCVSLCVLFDCVFVFWFMCMPLFLSLLFLADLSPLTFLKMRLQDVALIEEAPEGLHSSKCTTGTRLGLRVSRRPFPWPSTILHLDGRASWTQKSFPQTGLVCWFLILFRFGDIVWFMRMKAIQIMRMMALLITNGNEDGNNDNTN